MTPTHDAGLPRRRERTRGDDGVSIVALFNLIDRAFHAAIKRQGLDSRLGAWLAYWSGRVIFWQLRYVERIEQQSGWTPVTVETPAPIPYQLYVNGAVHNGFLGDSAPSTANPQPTPGTARGEE